MCGGPSSAPALCIDCADPCLVSSGGVTYAPCSSLLSTSAVTSFQLLSVAFILPPSAPKVLSKNIIRSQISLSVSIRLSSEGMVYTGIFASAASPSALSAIFLQNNVGKTSLNVTTIRITRLQPARNYTLYFVTKSLKGISMSYEEMIATKTSISTLCCRSLILQASSSSITEGQSYFNLFSVSSSSPPVAASLLVTPLLFSVSSFDSSLTPVVIPGIFVPSTLTVQNGLSSFSSFISLSNLPVGPYALSLRVEGREASYYNVLAEGSGFSNSSSSTLSLAVLSSAHPLPAPSLSTSVFSTDGSYLMVSFDSQTNMGGKKVTFTCGLLFSFACASSSKCQWIDKKTVHAYFQSSSTDNCAKPDEVLTLSPSADIKAACPKGDKEGDCSGSSSWPSTAVSSSLQIGKSLSVVSPTVFLTLPSTLGQCSPLTLDFSSSVGNGGRSWKSYSVEIQSKEGTCPLFNSISRTILVFPLQ
jgi:hypothetical protein